MAVCAPYHSVEPAAGAVYHNNSSCPTGKGIRPAYLREGVGLGRSLCPECVGLDLVSWRVHPLAPSPEDDG